MVWSPTLNIRRSLMRLSGALCRIVTFDWNCSHLYLLTYFKLGGNCVHTTEITDTEKLQVNR